MADQEKIREPLQKEFAERYVVNAAGEPVEVILTIADFERLLAELNDFRDRQLLGAEFEAWDSASDEALVRLEGTLS